jgi:hypothetical protein
VNNNDGRTDAAGNVIRDVTGGGKAAQAALDAADNWRREQEAANNKPSVMGYAANGYRVPEGACTDPGWTVDSTGHAVRPK